MAAEVAVGQGAELLEVVEQQALGVGGQRGHDRQRESGRGPAAGPTPPSSTTPADTTSLRTIATRRGVHLGAAVDRGFRYTGSDAAAFRAALTGSIYYWDIAAGRIVRINDGTVMRESFMPSPPQGCVGCHSVSPTGRYMAGRFGGGDNYGSVMDLTPNLTTSPPPTLFPVNQTTWWFSTWSPNEQRMAVTRNEFPGQLTLERQGNGIGREHADEADDSNGHRDEGHPRVIGAPAPEMPGRGAARLALLPRSR